MTTPITSQKRARAAWHTRLIESGGAYLTLPLAREWVEALDDLRRGEESRPACIKRLIREAAQSRC